MKYFTLRDNILLVSIVVILVAFSLVACERLENNINGRGYSEIINFSIGNVISQTRHAIVDSEHIVYKTMLRSEDNADSLYLTTFVSDMNSINELETRTTVTTADNIYGFIVYGYKYSGTTIAYDDLYIDNLIAMKSSLDDILWTFEDPKYWPKTENSKFVCIANNDISCGVTIKKGNNKLDLTYNVPIDRNRHRDVVVALAESAPNVESVPLAFDHIFSAVDFRIGDIARAGKLHSIAVKNVANSGTISLIRDGGIMKSTAWDIAETRNDFVVYNDTFLGGMELGDGKNEGKTTDYEAMMLPQDLVGAEVEISYTLDGEVEPKLLTAKLVGTWEPGKRYIYSISIDALLDIRFDNKDAICLDAHYVMNNQLSVTAGEGVDYYTISSDQSWLTIKTELSSLQKEGWWIIDDKGGTSISGLGQGENQKFWLLATENTGNTSRTATITISALGDGGISTTKTFVITQMCPIWNNIDGKIIGSERIEEAPTRVPWGPYWKSTSTDNSFKVTYSAPDGARSQIVAGLWQLLAGEGNITPNWNWIIVSYTVDYGDVANTMLNGTNSEEDGLANTSNGYSSQGVVLSEFVNYLVDNGSTKEGATFEEFDPKESAFINTLKKNAFYKKTESKAGETIEMPDIDKAKTDGTIVWYLPAKNEAISGVYKRNDSLNSCETPLDPFYDADSSNDGIGALFWTSTSVSGTVDKAYIYDFLTNNANEGIIKSTDGYRVRAVRVKVSN